MDMQIVQNIMGFMMRVQLAGQEVPAFNAAMNALQIELDGNNRETRKKIDKAD